MWGRRWGLAVGLAVGWPLGEAGGLACGNAVGTLVGLAVVLSAGFGWAGGRIEAQGHSAFLEHVDAVAPELGRCDPRWVPAQLQLGEKVDALNKASAQRRTRFRRRRTARRDGGHVGLGGGGEGGGGGGTLSRPLLAFAGFLIDSYWAISAMRIAPPARIASAAVARPFSFRLVPVCEVANITSSQPSQLAAADI